MRVKAETEGRTKDVGLLDVTPENFIVPKGEENCYHCRIEVVKFHSETGKRLSKPRIQVFGKKFFETFGLHNLRKQGFKVDILHDPNVWEAANKEKIEANKRAKAEIIAELKAAGVIPEEAKKPGRKPKAEKTEETTAESTENNENV